MFVHDIIITCDPIALCRCTAPLGSPHAVVQFVASDRADGVNFVLNTSYLISEVSFDCNFSPVSAVQLYDLVTSPPLKMYIHCRVLLSDQGVNFGSKSCNYNLLQSRYLYMHKTVFCDFFII